MAERLIGVSATGAGWPTRELAPLETLFLTSSRYEYLFWEMAWTQSSWPV